jgi:hypothetical protein
MKSIAPLRIFINYLKILVQDIAVKLAEEALMLVSSSMARNAKEIVEFREISFGSPPNA